MAFWGCAFHLGSDFDAFFFGGFFLFSTMYSRTNLLSRLVRMKSLSVLLAPLADSQRCSFGFGSSGACAEKAPRLTESGVLAIYRFVNK